VERIPKAQERRLLSKHLTGDFGKGSWQTIDCLRKRGMIKEIQEFDKPVRFGLSDLGVAYCDEHHMDISLA
jgi:hypothetical protein